MTTRKELMDAIDALDIDNPENEEIADSVNELIKDFIDDVETEVNSAKDYLENFSINNLDSAITALQTISSLSTDLY